MTSLRLPPVVIAASGMPCASTSRWCLLPALPRSTGEGPVAGPPFVARMWLKSTVRREKSSRSSGRSSESSSSGGPPRCRPGASGVPCSVRAPGYLIVLLRPACLTADRRRSHRRLGEGSTPSDEPVPDPMHPGPPRPGHTETHHAHPLHRQRHRADIPPPHSEDAGARADRGARPRIGLAFAALAIVQATPISFTITVTSIPLLDIAREPTSGARQTWPGAGPGRVGAAYNGQLLFGGRLADRYGGRCGAWPRRSLPSSWTRRPSATSRTTSPGSVATGRPAGGRRGRAATGRRTRPRTPRSRRPPAVAVWSRCPP